MPHSETLSCPSGLVGGTVGAGGSVIRAKGVWTEADESLFAFYIII